MRRLLMLFLLSSLVVACNGDKPADKKDTKKDDPKKSETKAMLPASLKLAAAPEKPMDVGDAKADAKEGQEIAITGRIGGSASPFVDGRAMMTIADLHGIDDCSKKGDDDCKTPWDY